MKRLMLLRHAKSDWPENVEDRLRPLARRGRIAAPKMGEYLKAEGLLPDYVLVSTAQRTRETWYLVSRALGKELPFGLFDGLYDAPPERLLQMLRSCSDSAQALLLIGHNPGLASLAAMLCGAGAPDQLEAIQAKFPTAALAVIDFDQSSWADLVERSGTLERFIKPRSLV